MTNYRGGAALPVPRGRAPLCACGCGYRTSTVRTVYIRGHRPTMSAEEVIRRGHRSNPETGCWDWTRTLYPNGYGRASVGGKAYLAHRVSYEAFVGPIPDGLTIDHLCRNRACVNPAHMEPVTAGENAIRGGGSKAAAAKRRAEYAASTHCPNGHRRTPEGTGVTKHGKKFCRPCRRAASLALYHRKRRELQRAE